MCKRLGESLINSQESSQLSLREGRHNSRKREDTILARRETQFFTRKVTQFSREGRYNSSQKGDKFVVREETGF